MIIYLYNIITSTGNHPTTIGRKSDSANSLSMTLVSVYAALFSDIPDPHIHVCGTRSKELTKWMEFNSSAVGSVSSKSANHYTSRKITNGLVFYYKLQKRFLTHQMLNNFLVQHTYGKDLKRVITLLNSHTIVKHTNYITL